MIPVLLVALLGKKTEQQRRQHGNDLAGRIGIDIELLGELTGCLQTRIAEQTAQGRIGPGILCFLADGLRDVVQNTLIAIFVEDMVYPRRSAFFLHLLFQAAQDQRSNFWDHFLYGAGAEAQIPGELFAGL